MDAGSLVLTLSQSNINIEKNTSTVTVAVRVQFKNNYWAKSETTSSCSVTCNGVTEVLSIGKYNIPANGSKELGSISFPDIVHNSDGSKTASVNASWTIPFSGGQLVEGKASKVLSSIPRISQVSVSPTVVDYGKEVTINIDSKSTTFKHTLRYSWGDITGTIASNIAKTAVWMVDPKFMELIPNGVSSWGTIYCDTYSGSTKIGTSSCQLTTYVPNNMNPQISSFEFYRVNGDITKDWGAYVKGISKVKLTLNGNGVYGSTISSYNLSGGGYTSSSATLVTEYLYIKDTNTFTGTITDSRGRTSTQSKTIVVQDYVSPSLSIKAERCSELGAIDPNGMSVKVSPIYTFSSIKGSDGTEKNRIVSKSFKIINPEEENTTCESGGYVKMGDGKLDPDYSYTLLGTVTDIIGRTATTTIIISTAKPVIDFKSCGNGVAVGKVAEKENFLDVGFNLRVLGETYFERAIKGIGESWLGCFYSSQNEWIGLYEQGLKKRKAWIGHNGTNILDIVNETGGITHIATELGVTGYLVLNGTRIIYIGGRGYITGSSTSIYIGLGSDDAKDVTTYIRGQVVRLFSHGGGVFLGSSGGTSITSDRNEKHDIFDLTDNYETFFKSLTPVTYKYNEGSSKRSHIGFIAQDVEDALATSNLDTKDFAGIIIEKDVTIDYEGGESSTGGKHYDKLYSLRYEEFIALNTKMIQKNMECIEKQAKDILDLKQTITNLEQQINKLATQ